MVKTRESCFTRYLFGLVSRNAELHQCTYLTNVCIIIHSTGGCQHQLSFRASGQSVSAAGVSQTALGPAVKQIIGTWTARTIAGERALPFIQSQPHDLGFVGGLYLLD